MNKPIIAVVGETASGKSDAAMQIASKFNGELIAADSRTIYKGMDIGTAKPSAEDQAEIPHFMLDVVEPDERFTVAQFQQKANTAIDDIQSRGKLPIIVGGTGLYTDSVLFNYSFGDESSSNKRAELDAKTTEELLTLAKQENIEIDAVETKNKRYLVRAIETRGEKHNDRSDMRSDTYVVGIKLQRNVMRKRIEDRVEIQFKLGLRKEVDELVNRYGWEHEALTGIGYREFKVHYLGDKSMSQVKRDIIQDTLHYAKRQRTWFKRNPNIDWFETSANLVDSVASFLSQYK